jgi:hypothetical protein
VIAARERAQRRAELLKEQGIVLEAHLYRHFTGSITGLMEFP